MSTRGVAGRNPKTKEARGKEGLTDGGIHGEEGSSNEKFVVRRRRSDAHRVTPEESEGVSGESKSRIVTDTVREVPRVEFEDVLFSTIRSIEKEPYPETRWTPKRKKVSPQYGTSLRDTTGFPVSVRRNFPGFSFLYFRGGRDEFVCSGSVCFVLLSVPTVYGAK